MPMRTVAERLKSLKFGSEHESGVLSAVKPGVAGAPTGMNSAKKGMSDAAHAEIQKSGKLIG